MKAKKIISVVKNKLSYAHYDMKSHAYNTYDRMRFWIADRFDGKLTPKEPDYLDYKIEQVSSPNSAYESQDISKSKHVTFKSRKRKVRTAYINFKRSLSERLDLGKEQLSLMNKSTVAGVSAIVVGGFALVFMATTVISSFAVGVTINGQRVGFVESEEQLVSMVKEVEQKLSEENYNANIKIDEDIIDVDSLEGLKSSVEMLDENKLKDTIVSSAGITATASAITVDGKPVLYVGNKENANTVLNSITQKYAVSGEDVFSNFRQDVKVENVSTDLGNLMPTKSAITYLMTGNKEVKKYKVKKGDTNWDIASAHGLTEKDIKKANPGMNTNIIKEGEVINISKIAPFVQVEVVATVNVTEKINYKTKKVKSEKLFKGQTKVRREGKRGQASVTKRAVYINGKEQSSQLIQKKIIKAPIKRVVVIGTKERPELSQGDGSSPYENGGGDSYVSGGSGVLSNPMKNMELSSPYGSRWGRMHTGIDLRNPSGTPIYAAAGGTVTYSGNDGAYGNTVRISHGNGMSTVYAHCNSLNVRSGATVSQGQQIATVGMTGRATGYHLHFEVRINGDPRNPYDYL
jgi:murein DD-endopeptidase MepM/ murein hydrolase activator NlpD